MLFFRLGHLCEGSGSLPSLLGQCPNFHRISFLKASLNKLYRMYTVYLIFFIVAIAVPIYTWSENVGSKITFSVRLELFFWGLKKCLCLVLFKLKLQLASNLSKQFQIEFLSLISMHNLRIYSAQSINKNYQNRTFI